MICVSCKKEVDDDLVFCTECGSRLFEPTAEDRTIVLPSSVTRSDSGVSKPSVKRNLIIGGILILSLLFVVGTLIFFNPFKPQNGIPNDRSKTAPRSNRIVSGQNRVNDVSSNSTISNTNADANRPSLVSNTENRTESILNEQFNVDPNSHLEFSFKVPSETAKLIGSAGLLAGEQFTGYVFLQDVFDERSVDPTYKMFSFDGEQGKTSEIEQTLVKGDYVLVFANSGDAPITLKVQISQTPR